MKIFAVTRERGTAWDHTRPMRQQNAWTEHAAFMDKLAEDGFIILGGPLGDGSKILLIIKSDNEIAIQTRLAADPWATMSLLKINKIEPWEILLGKTSKVQLRIGRIEA